MDSLIDAGDRNFDMDTAPLSRAGSQSSMSSTEGLSSSLCEKRSRSRYVLLFYVKNPDGDLQTSS